MFGGVGRIGRYPLASVKGAGFSLAAFMAAQSDGFWYDFGRPATLFQGTDETTPVDAFGQAIGRANDRRTGTNSPRNATQATTSFKPTYQTTGAAFDGTDDNQLTGYTAGAGANFIVAKVTVPTSFSGNHYIAGQITDSNNRFAIGANANGLHVLAGAVAYDAAAPILGQTTVVGATTDGSTVRLFVGDAAIDQASTISGGLAGAQPLHIGALNNAGAAASFWGGSIKAIIAGRQFLDLPTLQQIAADL